MPYITPDGNYYNGTGPVADGSIAVAARPSIFHVYTGTPSLDPAICWRTMNQTEIDYIKDGIASNIVNGDFTVNDVLKAFALVVLDEINILRAQHSLAARTAAQLKTAIINKLPNP